jgi:hypothetical protein
MDFPFTSSSLWRTRISAWKRDASCTNLEAARA